ncbi:hypothetical protein DMUE_1723 [Dictyocoela muelleri]|nr:hypothetical protein DMUE_1723 [Dictyocoela muelleri]
MNKKYVGEIMIIENDCIRIENLFYSKGDIFIVPDTRILEIEYLKRSDERTGILKYQEFEHETIDLGYSIVKREVFIIEPPIIVLKSKIIRSNGNICKVFLTLINTLNLNICIEDQISYFTVNKIDGYICRQKDISVYDHKFIFELKITAMQPKKEMVILFQNHNIFYRIFL